MPATCYFPLWSNLSLTFSRKSSFQWLKRENFLKFCCMSTFKGKVKQHCFTINRKSNSRWYRFGQCSVDDSFDKRCDCEFALRKNAFLPLPSAIEFYLIWRPENIRAKQFGIFFSVMNFFTTCEVLQGSRSCWKIPEPLGYLFSSSATTLLRGPSMYCEEGIVPAIGWRLLSPW